MIHTSYFLLEEVKNYAEKLRTNPFFAKRVKKSILEARKVLNSEGIGKNIPVELNRFLRNVNAKLCEFDFSQLRHLSYHYSAGITFTTTNLSDVVPKEMYDVFIRKYGNFNYIILIDRNLCEKRKRFVLAHELGHIYLNHFGIRNKFVRFREYHRDLIFKGVYSESHLEDLKKVEKKLVAGQEVEANAFAGELLVPSAVLKDTIFNQNTRNIEDLAEIFNVSLSVVYIQSVLNGIAEYLNI